MSLLDALVFGYLLVSVLATARAFYEVRIKNNPFGLTKILLIIGSFVWADALVLGIFWTVVCVSLLVTNNSNLFLLFLSVFWFIRSLGETLYWLHEQFTKEKRNKEETLILSNIFKNESVYFVYQLFWQCVGVISLISIILFLK